MTKRLDDLLTQIAVYVALAILLPLTALAFICIELGTAMNKQTDRLLHWAQQTFHLLRGLYPDGGHIEWPSK